MQIKLPTAMEPFRDQLIQTRQPFIRISPQAVRDTRPWESKVGGQPYLPKNASWPLAPDGQPLFFLAQLNFAEMPSLPPFPNKGIVQFFINDDDLYGMDFDDGENPDTFRVIFHPDVIENETLLQKNTGPSRDYDDLLPHHPETSFPLQFGLGEEVAPITDYQFYQHFGGDFFRQFGEQEWDIMGSFEKSVRAQGHKVGGYAYFTQDDPRRPEDPMLLLFQLDSDEKMDLMWGDMGVGHFFIREKDLLALDFSRVLYDWDCL
ncbi:MAG: YwqG family protein [Saprospiraceae bacterium]|nr:YwqG family protein [Saprospiraceae bacterium]